VLSLLLVVYSHKVIVYLEGLKRILLSYSGQLSLKLGIQLIKDVYEQVTEDIKHFIVVLPNGHLKVKPSKLTQVPVSVAVLCSEHWPYLKHLTVVATIVA
jgi:hypothetical protein